MYCFYGIFKSLVRNSFSKFVLEKLASLNQCYKSVFEIMGKFQSTAKIWRNAYNTSYCDQL